MTNKIYTVFSVETGEVISIEDRILEDTKHLNGIVFEGEYHQDKYKMVNGEIFTKEIVVSKGATKDEVNAWVQKLFTYPTSEYADWRVNRHIERGEQVPEELVISRQRIRDVAKELKAMEIIPLDFRDDKYWNLENDK